MLSLLSSCNITVDNISHLFNSGIQVSVLRLDKLHPVISGNKWFKLHYYLEEAKAQHKKNIITFGGAWSNHIIATAAACHINGLNATGIIRGEEPARWSPTLLQAKEYGMRLVFIPRSDYREKEIPAELLLTDDSYLIPEGGYGEPGTKGAAGILDHFAVDFTHCCCAVGTGTMMAGLINGSENDQTVIGISVMKNNRRLGNYVGSLVKSGNASPWQILHDYHFDGYARYQPPLLAFMNEFYRQTTIPSDFVYTGKLFYAVNDLIQKKIFAPGSKLLVIHSGGLQGNESLGKGVLCF